MLEVTDLKRTEPAQFKRIEVGHTEFSISSKSRK